MATAVTPDDGTDGDIPGGHTDEFSSLDKVSPNLY